MNLPNILYIFLQTRSVDFFFLSTWDFMVFNVHLVESHLKLWWLLVQPISPDVMDIYLDSHVLILLVATNFISML
jgi:hypothetical protein